MRFSGSGKLSIILVAALFVSSCDNSGSGRRKKSKQLGLQSSTVLSTWTAPFSNGWFPQISPDGKYLVAGFGESRLVNLSSKKVQTVSAGGNFASPGKWIRPGTYTYFRELDSRGTRAERFEVSVDNPTARVTSDDPSLVVGSMMTASDGNWVSVLNGRVVYNGRVVANNATPVVSISGSTVAYPILEGGASKSIQILENGVPARRYETKSEAHHINVNRDHIVYSLGPIYGIDPSGVETNLSVTPWNWEAHGQIFYVNGTDPWVISSTQRNDQGYLLIRPYGDKKVILLEDGDAAGLHAVENDGVITIAMNDPKGRLVVRTVSVNAPRVQIGEQQSVLPAPNHPIDLGYYYADGRYGNHNSEVFSYTNMTVLFAGAYDSKATWDNGDPALDIRKLFDASLRDAFRQDKTIFLLIGSENEWDKVLDVATPYWSKIKYIEMYHEQPQVTRDEAQAASDRLIAELSRRGLRKPLIGALESPGAESAPNMDWVGIEAYVFAPLNPNDPGNLQRMNQIIDRRKASVASGKKIVMVMMAYDRNGEWGNLETLKQLQYPAYLKSYDDPRVSAIAMFSYARPGGARDYPALKQIHQQISSVIFGGASAPGPAPAPTSNPICPTVKPGPDWICLQNGNWVPADYPIEAYPAPPAPQSAPQPVPAPLPAPPPPPAPNPAPTSSGCPTVKPGPDWVCLPSGDWVPHDHPLAAGI